MNDVGQHHSSGHDHATRGGVSPEIEDKPFTDPVCGVKVAADAQKEARHQGQAYHFCSARCLARFHASPDSYLAPRQVDPAAAAPAGVVYTCPMHPEIRQPVPGNCHHGGHRARRHPGHPVPRRGGHRKLSLCPIR